MLLQISYLKALRKAKDRVAMDIEGLIENLKALSDILKSRPIRESVSLNDFKNSYDRFEAAVSDLRVMSKNSELIIIWFFHKLLVRFCKVLT